MKKLIFSLFILICLSSVSFAQAGDRRAWGYLFGGGEGLLHKGFGIGAELGYFAPASETFGNGVGLLSVNPAYHFGNASASKKVVPFVTGGFSLAFRNSAASGGGNVGGGVQYWFKEKAALRVEYRTHIFSSDRPYLHSLRVGISFR